MNEVPDVMNYISEYILSTNGEDAMAYLGEKQVLSLLGPRKDSKQLLESLPPAMELLDGDLRVPVYLWRDVYALLVKEGLNKPENEREKLEW